MRLSNSEMIQNEFENSLNSFGDVAYYHLRVNIIFGKVALRLVRARTFGATDHSFIQLGSRAQW